MREMEDLGGVTAPAGGTYSGHTGARTAGDGGPSIAGTLRRVNGEVGSCRPSHLPLLEGVNQ